MAAPRVARLVLTAGFAVVAMSCQQSPTTAKTALPSPPPSVVPAGYGVVVGGIDPCVGPAPPSPPGYAWGTVEVYRASAVEPFVFDTPPPVLPTQLIASESVAAGVEFRFALPPGAYVLVAHYEEWQSVWPWIGGSVVAGRTTRQNIPSPCF